MNADFMLGLSRFKIHMLSSASDLADRFTYQLSCTILIIMCTLLTLRQYYSAMIQCIFPSDYGLRGLDQYAENYCWAESTLFVRGQVTAGGTMSCGSSTHVGAQVINYYKWVPFMLSAQCFLCYLPHLVWKMLNSRSGINVKTIVSNAIEACNNGGDASDKLKLAGRSLSDALYVQREYRKGCIYNMRQHCGPVLCCFGAKRVGNYLTILYLFIKLTYIVNAAGQMVMMASFLDLPYYYGAMLLRDLHTGHNWNVTGVFPRVTICKFPVQVGNLQFMDVCAQCVIPFNFLLESMYIVLWIWFVFVLLISIFSLITWVCRSVPSRRRHFIKKYFKLLRFEMDSNSRRQHFIESHLRSDGVLILRLIAENTGEHYVSELLLHVWNRYLERNRPISTDEHTPFERDTIRGGSGQSKTEPLDHTDGYLSDGICGTSTRRIKPSHGSGYRGLRSPPHYSAAGASAPPKFVDEIDDSGHRSSTCSAQSNEFREQPSPGSMLSRSHRPVGNSTSKV